VSTPAAYAGKRGAAPLDQFLGQDHRRRGVRGVPVGAHHVGVLLGHRGAADHDVSRGRGRCCEHNRPTII